MRMYVNNPPRERVTVFRMCVRAFLFDAPPPADFYTLSLHDALPISVRHHEGAGHRRHRATRAARARDRHAHRKAARRLRDRKSTRLNSSHRCISYAVFCLKKKKTTLSILILGTVVITTESEPGDLEF